MSAIFPLTALLTSLPLLSPGANLERLPFNNPGLNVDLGVGLWAMPLPMDWDGDGDLDLIVSCPDKPFNGTYFFENPGGPKMPIFRAPVRVGKGSSNIQVSYVEGQPRILIPGAEFVDFLVGELTKTRKLSLPSIKMPDGNVRAKQWKFVDYDGDGDLDLSYGAGSWGAYGWDDGFNDKGEWVKGPLQGFVIIIRNSGTDAEPVYQENFRVQAGGKDAEVYGMPSPNFADFDGDGDLDLLCGEFLDGFTYFQNTGTRTEPVYAPGRYLTKDGKKIAMHVQMITPTVLDWDRDDLPDIVMLDHEGYLAFFKREKRGDSLTLLPGQRIFRGNQFTSKQTLVDQSDPHGLLRLNPHDVGGSGRRKLCFTDWDGDGDLDLIVNSVNAHLLLNEGTQDGITTFGEASQMSPQKLAGHTTCPTVVDWDKNGKPDLLLGAEDGHFYSLRNPER